MFGLEKGVKPIVIVQVQEKERKNSIGNPEYVIRFFMQNQYSLCNQLYFNITVSLYRDCTGRFEAYLPYHVQNGKYCELESCNGIKFSTIKIAMKFIKRIEMYQNKLQPKTFVDWLEVIKKAYGVKKLYDYDYDSPVENTQVIMQQARNLDIMIMNKLREIAEANEGVRDSLVQIALAV